MDRMAPVPVLLFFRFRLSTTIQRWTYFQHVPDPPLLKERGTDNVRLFLAISYCRLRLLSIGCAQTEGAMRKFFIVLILLVIAATYSAIKLSFVNVIPVAAGIITIPVDDSLQANEPSAFERTPILNIKVGGYTPPAPSGDADREDMLRRLTEYNRPWTPTDVARDAALAATVPAQRLGDVLRAGFIENNAGYNLFKWLDQQISSEYDPKFSMRDNQDLYKDIPADMILQFTDASSRVDGERIRTNIMQHLGAQKRLSDAGVVGTGAAWVVGMFDVDSLVIVLLTWNGMLRLRNRVRAVRAREKSVLGSA